MSNTYPTKTRVNSCAPSLTQPLFVFLYKTSGTSGHVYTYMCFIFCFSFSPNYRGCQFQRKVNEDCSYLVLECLQQRTLFTCFLPQTNRSDRDTVSHYYPHVHLSSKFVSSIHTLCRCARFPPVVRYARFLPIVRCVRFPPVVRCAQFTPGVDVLHSHPL